MNWAEHEDGSFFVPTCFAQRLARVLRRMRFESPSRVRAQLSGNSEFAQQILRFHVARDDQRIVDITRAHVFDQRIHVPGFRPVGKR